MSDLGTHYTLDAHAGKGRAVIYHLDTCERCGGTVEAANAVGVSVRDAKRLGAVELPHRPSEAGYCNHFGGAVCSQCYGLGPRESLADTVAAILDGPANSGLNPEAVAQLADALDRDRTANGDAEARHADALESLRLVADERDRLTAKLDRVRHFLRAADDEAA